MAWISRFALAACAACIITLGGCGGGGSPNTDPKPDPKAPKDLKRGGRGIADSGKKDNAKPSGVTSAD